MLMLLDCLNVFKKQCNKLAYWKPKLVAHGCDGASINIACNGLKVILKRLSHG